MAKNQIRYTILAVTIGHRFGQFPKRRFVLGSPARSAFAVEGSETNRSKCDCAESLTAGVGGSSMPLIRWESVFRAAEAVRSLDARALLQTGSATKAARCTSSCWLDIPFRFGFSVISIL